MLWLDLYELLLQASGLGGRMGSFVCGFEFNPPTGLLSVANWLCSGAKDGRNRPYIAAGCSSESFESGFFADFDFSFDVGTDSVVCLTNGFCFCFFRSDRAKFKAASLSSSPSSSVLLLVVLFSLLSTPLEDTTVSLFFSTCLFTLICFLVDKFMTSHEKSYVRKSKTSAYLSKI